MFHWDGNYQSYLSDNTGASTNKNSLSSISMKTAADNIQQLKQINCSLASEYLADIRLNYKRRRNLISILSKF